MPPLRSSGAGSWTRSGQLAALGLAFFGALTASFPARPSSCKLHKLVEFPITMTNLRPLMTASINHTEVRLLVDSGAFFSTISPASAAELKLATYPAPFGLYITGVAGTAHASLARVKEFTLAGVPLHDIEFLVGGSEIGSGSIGVLGQNILHIADIEYDLGQGAVRLMRPEDCGKAALAYWARASMPYSVINIEPTTREKPFAMASASINGREIRVLFDSGAGVSTLSLKAAARVGVKPDSPGVEYAGQGWGFGRETIAIYIAPFASFKIGDEEIRNTRLRIADIELPDADMLIGPDFFLSHRIYVANGQHKLYFTYNGGPVFNLSGAKYAGAEPAPTDTSAAAPPAPAGAAASTGAAPGASSAAASAAAANSGDAAEYSRRGAAFASRRDFGRALAALTRACELAPTNAEYFYQRGSVYRQMKQAAPAIADFDQALKLKPDDAKTLISRAELLLEGGEKVRAAADLGAADAVAPKEADERYEMAQTYERADLLEAAIAQYDLWIAAHDVDARQPYALNGRCWARALRGIDLALALKDCDAALKRTGRSSPVYERAVNSRGLVLLRMGNYDKSIAAYDTSLKIDPKDAWSWYGRGIDKLREQKSAEGEADIAQARTLWPKVDEEFARRGIAP
jgi:tetratricopeptide (TPR) repeat protein/predicted aspartyl protease